MAAATVVSSVESEALGLRRLGWHVGPRDVGTNRPSKWYNDPGLMRKCLRLCVWAGLVLAGVDANAGSPAAKVPRRPLPATEAYRYVAPSVVVVEARVIDGVSQGSGVVVGDREIATNNHVVQGSSGFVLIHQGDRTWRAEIERTDKEHDLALLSVLLRSGETFNLPVAHIRSVDSMRIGETVYAVGAPQGLERTLSAGLVSGILQLDATNKVVQTTAAISPGSSGGGLFDSRGSLVGITTLYLKEGQNLNFAVPADRIEALRRSPSTPAAQYTLSAAAQSAPQTASVSKTCPAVSPDLPTPLHAVRAVILISSAEGPVASAGKITSPWIRARAAKALTDAGFQVFASQADAHKANAYALSLVIDLSSMWIEGTGFYPWTLNLSLGDSTDFADGSNSVVLTWQSSTYGYGGSDVVINQVAKNLDQELSKFAIDVLKARTTPSQEMQQSSSFVDPFAN